MAFLRQLALLSPGDYQRLIADADRGVAPTNWATNDEEGFAAVQTANSENGKHLLQSCGCISCHELPGMSTAHVGPPLNAYAERQYIAGSIVNLPANTVNWILDPKKYKPRTAMPKLPLQRREAMDIAAYLYRLGSPKRIEAIRQTGGHGHGRPGWGERGDPPPAHSLVPKS